MDISEARRNSSTSTNSNTKYQRCSKDGCGSVLSPHSRSTVCDQCLQKYTRYRATDVPYPAMMGESSAPVQVRSNFSDRLDITSANPYGPFNTQLSHVQQDRHFPGYRRPHFSVPGMPSGPQGPPLLLRMKVPRAPTQDLSVFNHFNSKGELINVPLSSSLKATDIAQQKRPLATNNPQKASALEPEAPHRVLLRKSDHSRSVKQESTNSTLNSLSSLKSPLSSVLAENLDLGNAEDVDMLELVYPPDPKPTEPNSTLSSAINPSPNSLVALLATPNADNGSTTAPLSSLPSRPSIPLPRRKAHQPRLPILPVQGSASTQPSLIRNCSTLDCAGVIPDDSTSLRCYSCVMNAWKLKKQGLTTLPSNDKGKGKAVSWADQKDSSTTFSSSLQSRISNPQNDKLPIKGALKQTSSRPKSHPSDGPSVQNFSPSKSAGAAQAPFPGGATVRVPPPLPVRSRLLIKIGKKPVVNDPHNINDQSNSVSGLDPEGQITSSSIIPSGSSTDINAGSGLTKDVAKDVDHQAQMRAVSPSDTVTPGPLTASGVPGWDSELSELSDSLDEGESEGDASESESEPAPSTSPLVIRIPRRQFLINDKTSSRINDPSNIDRCGSRSCGLALPPGYRWKSCILCRARNREYQRSRQKLQGRHAKLDEELQSAQGSVYPFQEFVNPAESLIVEGNAPNVVPGAQLCSVRSCTYIIPPSSEYRWKMCARCRKRTRERRLRSEAKASGQPIAQLDIGSESEGESLVSVYQRLSGVGSALKRCSSRDCGMLLDNDATSRKCRQCTARISGKVDAKQQTRGVSQPTTTGLVTSEVSPFQKYKSLPALLTEFNARLSNFLEAQTYYFLSKYKEHLVTPQETVVFTFEGEYSVVTLDFDLASRKSEIEKSVLMLRDHIQRFGSFTFNSQRWVSTLDGGKGFITRFSCVRQVPVIPPLGLPGQAAPNSSKTMHGELEVDVLVDRSHRFFPGQRTIVRFQSMG